MHPDCCVVITQGHRGALAQRKDEVIQEFTGPLGYYGQREWKIVPNLPHNHEWHYEELGEEDRRELCQLNPTFFQRRISDNKLLA